MDKVSDLQDALPTPTAQLVHIEVCQKSCSSAQSGLVREHVVQLLKRNPMCYDDFVKTEFDDLFLMENVAYVSASDIDCLIQDKRIGMNLNDVRLHIHVYQLHEDGPAQEELDDEDLAAANHWLLPSADFNGMWESLIFDSSIKHQLLQYASTTLLFSDKNINSNIISWNRVILLHGPPGTGKTSLCKALAQKLVIQLSDRYSYGQLIEINSHSLFSKWFSESGKLVMKMFQKIQELIDDPSALVCVLIDEVESLTSARKSAMSGNEPSDAIRVVNALLTQLDYIKKFPNVMILTTSNITGAIDLAFVDRADIKQYIGPPSRDAVYKIYHSCIDELVNKEIIYPRATLFDLKTLNLMRKTENEATEGSLKLKEIANKSEGLSGRTLRKLPFIAHAVYVQASKVTLNRFLEALNLTVDRQFQEREDLLKGQ